MIGEGVKNPKNDSLSVEVSRGEDPNSAIRRFTKKVRASGLLQELLQRRYYEKPSVKRKKKHSKALIASLVEKNKEI